MKPPQGFSGSTDERKSKRQSWDRKPFKPMHPPSRKNRGRKSTADDYSDWRLELL
jgi:hypothetical protein